MIEVQKCSTGPCSTNLPRTKLRVDSTVRNVGSYGGVSRADARALREDDGATLDDLREAVTTLEDTNRIARRVLGNAHPTTNGNEAALRLAQAALRARETPSPSTPSESG